ncbi:oligosaccharide flippase family protein [Aquihabitans sp. G128]|uniref:oligosaccharide flippase family protein n=1 Tax=Aquihabitans sp. G128 TaxID=2849779 RepID=UPI001C21FE09|nr:oligosaccharide flippase family protein [Aquihabitans sp. G128]QXC59132.1 oligosaccharide flippase family protein [Aquihabitans sp. G128]
MAEPTTSSAAPGLVAGVARGGAANLIGAVIYGLSGFVLLIVLNRGIGVRAAGVVVVAIAIFNIVTVIAGIGTSTGLVRTISTLRATRQAHEIPAAIRIALVPVAVLSLAVTALLWFTAPNLAEIFANGRRVEEVTEVLRAMVVFVPFATLHAVVVQATRGFDTMLPQVLIEKIARSLSLPIVAGGAAAIGMGPRGVGAAWAASNVPALAISSWSLYRRVHRAVAASGQPKAAATPTMRKEFWGYTGPRAIAQASNVVINWFDTILVGAILSTTAAGIYASGTRYLLPGLFAADALVQVISPRLSGLLAVARKAEASALVQIVGGWQVVVMWPVYLITLIFPTPLLTVFGDEVIEARGALVALSIAMLLTTPTGPSGAVILMAGRSRQAMFDTLVVLVVNIGGNLIFVPRYGLTAAGVVWGASIVVAEVLHTWQTNVSMGLRTIGRPAVVGMALSAATVGGVGVVARLLGGDAWGSLLATCSIGGGLYVAGLWTFRSPLHLDSWWNGVRRRSSPGTTDAAIPARGTT